MKMFSDCSGECWNCSCAGGCLAGHGDDDFVPASKDQLIYRLDSNQYGLYRPYIIKMLKEKFNYDYTDEVGKERLMMRTVYNMMHDIKKSSKWYFASNRPSEFDNYALLGELDITSSLSTKKESRMHVYSLLAGYIVFDIIMIDCDGDEYIRLESAANEGQYVYAGLDCELHRPIKSCFDELLNSYLDSCSNPRDRYAVNMKRVCEDFPAFLYNFIIYI